MHILGIPNSNNNDYVERYLRGARRYAKTLEVILSTKEQLPEPLDERAQRKIAETINGRILFSIQLSPVGQALYVEAENLTRAIHRCIEHQFPNNDPFLNRLRSRWKVVDELFRREVLDAVPLFERNDFLYTLRYSKYWVVLGSGWRLIYYERGLR